MSKTRRLSGVLVAAAAALVMNACGQGSPMSPTAGPSAGLLQDKPSDGNGNYNGNGAPSGSHFNLNLIGVPQNKTADISGGSRIFIYYQGRVDILLREGDFAVLDGNGTDDGEASFQLPNPDPAGNGDDLAYSVWIRPVAGKGSISFQSCFIDSGGAEWCYAGALVQNLTKQNRFKDVSRDLLQVCVDTDADGIADTLEPLFADEFSDYFWRVDNDGMRNVQMRFYPLATTPKGGHAAGCELPAV